MVTLPTPTETEIIGKLFTPLPGITTLTAQALGPPVGAVGDQLVITVQSLLVTPVHV